MFSKPNIRTIYFLALISVIVLFAVIAILVPRQSQSHSLIDKMYRDNLLSFYFEDEVRDIAKIYVRETRYAGRININAPPLENYLNLYIFYFSDDLPGLLRYNCTSFPSDEIILCDHALLDSIYETLPLVVEEDDPVQHPILMNWIIGHEIGHIVLQHQRSQYLNYHLTNVDSKDQNADDVVEQSIVAWTTDVYAGNKYEEEADQFAIRKINKAPSAWLQYGDQIANAIFWYANESSTPVIYFDPDSHPPMLLRTLHFFYQLREEYEDFNKYYPDLVGDIPQMIEVRIGTVEADDTFFGGYYLGSDYSPEDRLYRLIDHALALWVRGNIDHASYLASSICQSSSLPDKDPIYDLLLQTLCLKFTQVDIDSAMNADLDFSILHKCDELEPESAGHCVGLLFLHGISCHTNKWDDFLSTTDICLAREEYLNLHAKYHNNVAFFSRYALVDWMLPTEYMFRSEVAVDSPEELDQFVANAIYSMLESGYGQLGRDLLLLHLDNLEKESDQIRLVTNLQMLWNTLALIGDKEAANATSLEVRKILANAHTPDGDEDTSLMNQYVFVINEGLLFSLDTSNCKDAIPLLVELAEQQLPAIGDKELKAAIMGNVAAIHICAENGDSETALELAKESLNISQELNNNNEDILIGLWTLTFAYYKAGQYANAKAKAEELISLYQEITGNEFDTSTEAWVSGALIPLGDVVQLEKLVVEALNAVSALASAGDDVAAQKQVDQALILIEPEMELPASTWNMTCWWGSLYGHAADVVDGACEHAVAMSTEDQLAGYRDSRGLGRVLTGDIEGGIEDLEFFVANWTGPEANQRIEWLERLKAGEDPMIVFDAETITMLRKE